MNTRKIMAVVSACVVLPFGFNIATTTAAHASATCNGHVTHDEHYFYNWHGSRDLKVYTTVVHDLCTNDQTGNKWVEPYSREIGYVNYNDGVPAKLDCSVAGSVQNVKFNLYFSDNIGNVINPAEQTLPCANDGAAKWYVTMDQDGNPRLQNCGGAPKWKSDVQVSMRLGADMHTTLSQTMWGFTGPFPVSPACS